MTSPEPSALPDASTVEEAVTETLPWDEGGKHPTGEVPDPEATADEPGEHDHDLAADQPE